MITPESRSFWVRAGAVPGRTMAYQPVSMQFLLLINRMEIYTFTAAFLLRNATAINWPRLPAAPATATKPLVVAIWKGVVRERKCLEKVLEDRRWERESCKDVLLIVETAPFISRMISFEIKGD
jgi:hypothetical protein